jgi:hypothetical protein
MLSECPARLPVSHTEAAYEPARMLGPAFGEGEMVGDEIASEIELSAVLGSCQLMRDILLASQVSLSRSLTPTLSLTLTLNTSPCQLMRGILLASQVSLTHALSLNTNPSQLRCAHAVHLRASRRRPRHQPTRRH